MNTTQLTQSLLSLLAVSTLALADGIIDSGFEGVGSASSPWKRVVFEEPYVGSPPVPTYQCGIVSVKQQHITRNGYARLDPIYIKLNGWSDKDGSQPICSESVPCDGQGWAPGDSRLKQSNIEITNQSEYVELTFDYRIERMTIDCEVDYCQQSTTVAVVRLQGDNCVSADLILSADEDSVGWRRARFGVPLNGACKNFQVEFVLSARVTTTGSVAFRGALEIDNVQLESFALPCNPERWICPGKPEPGNCLNYPFLGNSASFSALFAPAAADVQAPFICERPCNPLCAGDIDGDGVVNGADLGAVLSSWDVLNGEGDVNHDGLVNGADLAALLSNWGCTN